MPAAIPALLLPAFGRQGRGRRAGLVDDSALQESPAAQLDTIAGSLGSRDRLLAVRLGSALSVESGPCASPIRKAEMMPSVAPTIAPDPK